MDFPPAHRKEKKHDKNKRNISNYGFCKNTGRRGTPAG